MAAAKKKVSYQFYVISGFTCPQYSTVPRYVLITENGRIFEMKVEEDSEWREISIDECTFNVEI